MKRLIILLILCITASAYGWTGMKPILGEQVNKSHSLSDMIAFWPLNEGSGDLVNDLSGNGLTGTASTHIWQGGKFGPAISFDGSGTMINCGNGELVDNIFDGGASIVVWVYAKGYGESDNGRIIAKSTHTGAQNGWELQTRSTNSGIAFLMADDASVIMERWLASMSLNAWHQIVVTYTANTNDGIIYIDGVNANATHDINNAGVRDDDTGIDLIIGNITTGARTYDGLIDNLSIYNRILTASEISQLYYNPFCFMAEQLDITQMYTYAAAPPPTGSQIILISGIPIILIGCAVYTLRRAA